MAEDNKPSQEPTPDGWKAGDLVWDVAPDEVTPAMQDELQAHLEQQRQEAQQGMVAAKVQSERQKRRKSGK
jgi:hypothetical protein